MHILKDSVEITVDDYTYFSLDIGSFFRIGQFFIRPPPRALLALRVQGSSTFDAAASTTTHR